MLSKNTLVSISRSLIVFGLLTFTATPGAYAVNKTSVAVSKATISSSPVVVYKNQIGKATGEGISIRRGPGVQYGWQAGFHLGETFKILGTSGSFYKVSYSGVTGYVSKQYVKIMPAGTALTASPAAPAAPAASTVVYKNQTGIAASEGISIRTGAGTPYNKQGSFHLGETVKILGTSGSFYKVSYSGVTGYVSNQDLIIADSDLADIEVAQADVTNLEIQAAKDLTVEANLTTAEAADILANTSVAAVDIPAETAILQDKITAAEKTITAARTAFDNKVVAVSTVSAISASSFKATFSGAVADTSKVVFSVKGSSGTVVTTTATWNDAKTEATLTATSNLAPDTYVVDVMNDTKDLGTSSVAITEHKVLRINITSTVLALDTTTGLGYATYKVYDQYGADITNTTLGNDITWTPGVGVYQSSKNGTLVIGPNGTTPLSQYINTSVVINGYDTDDYVTASSTLTVQQTGTLSNITLNNLTSPNNDDLNAGNTSGLWYLDFTATDASGNPTTDYNVIKAGIQSVNVGSFLQLASGTTNGVEQDPNDNTKAAIPVEVSSTASTLAADTPVPITIITKGGKSSTMTVTLKKAASLSSFTISAPSTTVAAGKTVTLPFTAYDQNGLQLTKYTDFVNSNGTPKVSISASQGTLSNNNTGIVRNSDGTASVQWTAPSNITTSTTVYIQTNVISTGKSNQLTLTVQKGAIPDSLAVTTASGKTFFQEGATEGIDFGYSKGGLTLNDQYGASIDVTNQDNAASYYTVLATPNDTHMKVQGNVVSLTKTTVGTVTTTTKAELGAGTVSINGSGVVQADYTVGVTPTTSSASATVTYAVRINNDAKATLVAGTPGTSTVNYETYSVAPATGILTNSNISKSVQYTVMTPSDITGYTLDTVATPIKVLGTVTAANATKDYYSDNSADPTIWGTTSSGSRVRINPTSIVSASLDGTHFQFADGTTTLTNTVPFAASDLHVYAKDVSTTAGTTTASTTLTVVAKDSDNNYVTATTPITSSTDASVVSSIGFVATNQTGTAGLSVTGNTVTADDYTSLLGKALTEIDPITKIDTTSPLYFFAKDQYGTEDGPISSISVSSKSTNFAGITVTGDATNGFILGGTVSGTPTTGDYFVLTATSANGHISTVKVVLK